MKQIIITLVLMFSLSSFATENTGRITVSTASKEIKSAQEKMSLALEGVGFLQTNLQTCKQQRAKHHERLVQRAGQLKTCQEQKADLAEKRNGLIVRLRERAEQLKRCQARVSGATR